MKPMTILPEEYCLYGDFEPRKFVKARAVLYIAAILGIVLLLLMFDRIFPNPDPAVSLAWRSISVLYRMALFALVFYAWLILHEYLHAMFIRIFSGQWPQVKLVRLWGIPVGGYNAFPGWYYPRNQFIIFDLAPFVLLTPFLYLLNDWVPPIFVLPVQDCFLLNIVGSFQDTAVALIAALHPPSTLITWDGKIYHQKSEMGVKAIRWQDHLRSRLEHWVTK